MTVALRRLAVIALAALAVGSPGAPVSAGNPGDDAVDLATFATDAIVEAAGGCTAADKTLDVSPVLTVSTTAPPAGSSSTWYAETSGTKFTVGSRCRAGVKVTTCIRDSSVPAVYTTYATRPCASGETTTGRSVSKSATIKVPYVGADAGGVRPAGLVVIQHWAYQLGSNGRWQLYQCREDHAVVQPAGSVNYVYDSDTYYGSCPTSMTDVVQDTAGL